MGGIAVGAPIDQPNGNFSRWTLARGAQGSGLMLLKMISGPAEDLPTIGLRPHKLVFRMQKQVSDLKCVVEIVP